MPVITSNDRQKIKDAFVSLTSKGYVALWRYMCDRSTAYHEINHDYPNAVNYVFYTKHDDDTCFDDDGTLIKPLYLHWGGDGATIKKKLEENGLRVDWDGDAENCITLVPDR